jgi:ABC-type glycerol-3-phosphate transport system substrate-binding protein
LNTQARWFAQLESSDRWVALPFLGEDGKPFVISGGLSYGVVRGEPEKQLGAWLLARWLSQPQVAAKVTEALPALPVRGDTLALIDVQRNEAPYDQALPLLDWARPAPALASWRDARRLLEDAAWQLYHLPPDGLGELLPQLDAAVGEAIR